MSGLDDVEALLDAAATEKNGDKEVNREAEDRVKSDRTERKDRDRSSDRSRRDRSPGRGRRDRSTDRDRNRDRDRDRARRERGDDGQATPRSDAGSHKSRRRSRSRDDDRRHSRRHRGGDGDFYRGGRGGRDRSPRSRSPRRHHRRDDHRDRDDRPSYSRRDDDRHRGGRTPRRDATPQLTEDERDRRTVFVQQLAARLRTKELKEFFEKVGPVNEAQIVKDRISGRSKGYVLNTRHTASQVLPPPPSPLPSPKYIYMRKNTNRFIQSRLR